MGQVTPTIVKSRTNAVFSLLQLCRGMYPGPWHYTAAVATQMTASMANALTWCASCCNSTSSVSQAPWGLHWFNYHFPLWCAVNAFHFFCLSSQVMLSNRYVWKRNDAGPLLLAGLSLAQRTWAEWLCVPRGRDWVAEELLSWCISLCCLWSHRASPQTSHPCSWSPALTPVYFSLALYPYRGMESCCGGRWVSHSVILWAAFPAPPPRCRGATFYWLL